ncbi:hypothetical protein [Halocella sp. SP3-1]|uniref:Gfo/Idh/MocA family protein n=1 Tax=Halocella sp. SP3-1 TaxID=2382161 RepID=UPI000F75D01B|nr:hypothetical protein [Halocella sp. SP3-1]AZO95380.1 hypothetical protein D7D81_12680 [Halocella sp. SP3-1]
MGYTIAQVEGVLKKSSTEKGEVKVDDITIGMVRMKDGAMGTIEAWRLATGTEDNLRFEIHGSKRALRFNLSKELKKSLDK